jgi:hypothetical protein
MRDDDVEAAIERIVEGARIPGRRRRDDLRRELRSHFEDGGSTPDAARDTLARFGDAAVITGSLRHVYRWDYRLFYVTKIAASIAGSLAAAIFIEAIANVRVRGETLSWRPGFVHGAGLAVVIVLALITAAEAMRAPFSVPRVVAALGAYAALCLLVANGLGAIETATVLTILSLAAVNVARTWASRAALTLAAFAAAEYALHFYAGVNFGAVRALAASGVLVAVWAATIAIVSRADRAFANAFAVE